MQISLDIEKESVYQKILDFISKSFKKNDVTLRTVDEISPTKEHPFSGLWKDRDTNILIEILKGKKCSKP